MISRFLAKRRSRQELARVPIDERESYRELRAWDISTEPIHRGASGEEYDQRLRNRFAKLELDAAGFAGSPAVQPTQLPMMEKLAEYALLSRLLVSGSADPVQVYQSLKWQYGPQVSVGVARVFNRYRAHFSEHR